jgi:hypothetical protein
MNDTDVMNKPELIYYMYEKGFRLNIHHQTAVARKSTETVNLIVPEHERVCDCCVLCQCFGETAPAGILFRGKHLKSQWGDDTPTGMTTAMTTKATRSWGTSVSIVSDYRLDDRCSKDFSSSLCPDQL